MSSDRERGRSDLFLLRLWTDEPGGPVIQNGDKQPDEDWKQHGRLMNMLNGEGHNFDSWEGLVGLLREMRILSPTGEKISDGE